MPTAALIVMLLLVAAVAAFDYGPEGWLRIRLIRAYAAARTTVLRAAAKYRR